MRTAVLVLYFISASIATYAQTNSIPIDGSAGIDMGGRHVGNLGRFDLSSSTNDFTHAEVAHHGASIGLLVGINPEDGQPVTNVVNLLPLMVRSAYAAGEVNAGLFTGDGSGLVNIPAGQVVGYLPISSLPTSGVWNVEGLTLKNARFDGPLSIGNQPLDLKSDLNVEGTLSGDASGLSNIPAGGADGSIQFNEVGKLAGHTNYFIHAQTGNLAFSPAENNIMRAYKWGEVSPEKLIYVVRTYKDTTELCMLAGGSENIRLRGDGSAYFSGSVEIDGDITFANGMKAGSENWYIPETGDLSMGAYIDGAGLAIAAGEYVPDSTDLSMGSYTRK